MVDENNTCLVYNIKNNELLFQVMFCFIIAHLLFDCILFKPFICTESKTNPCMKVNKDFKAKPLLTSVLQNSLSVLTHYCKSFPSKSNQGGRGRLGNGRWQQNKLALVVQTLNGAIQQISIGKLKLGPGPGSSKLG